MTERRDVAGLITSIDGLEALLERAGLSELEVEAGGTTIILRGPAALSPLTVSVGAAALAAAPPAAAPPADAASQQAPAPGTDPPADAPPAAHVVVAPLTGVFYRSPSPGAVPYLREGGPVNAGQVIGLIEAMKLFNEIKSDVTGTVRRLVAGEGALVKARDPLIEVELG
jgi:acetyl-CoA carboxylase biotin carboxyl carrier protein